MEFVIFDIIICHAKKYTFQIQESKEIEKMGNGLIVLLMVLVIVMFVAMALCVRKEKELVGFYKAFMCAEDGMRSLW